ncbi:MATE family efflux transporter [Hathewaya limosa]|uniref:Multidrug export protein MepA n=1 Tax=Hathewaya limosa TaxID=1536 RepID=A0ABU0JNJ1_HATLI|nr:MATE family efflux transporter [Hathewaya limosa]MDQ0478652.1 putative MATE family efflux protein [Hathewaya limosa]
MQEKIDLLKDDINKLFIKYLTSSVLAAIAISMYIFVDTMFIGIGVGSDGIAALNIAMPIFTVSSSISLMLGIGGASTASVFIGRGQRDKSVKVFNISIYISIILGIIISIFGNIFSKQICVILGASTKILPLVNEYLSILISFSWAFILSVVLGSFIRNDKDPKLVMIATVIGNITNVILDYVFIFIFHWGMKGAVIATVISPIVNLVILCIHFTQKYNTLVLKKISIRFSLILRIFKNGFGTFILEVCRGTLLFMFNKTLMNLGGEIYVSAYGIITNIAYVGTCIFAGIAQCIQPIVSVNFGGKKTDRVYEALKYALFTAISLAIFCYGLLLIFPKDIVGIFTKGNTELINICVKGIRLYFLGYVFCASNVVSLYFLQSIEKAKASIFLSLSSGIIFSSLGLLILVPVLNVSGVWLTVPFAEGITFIISIILVKKYKKSLLLNKEKINC